MRPVGLSLAGVVVLAAAGGGWVLLREPPPPATTAPPAGSAVAVTLGDVVARQQVNGTLTYDGAYTVTGHGGTVTRLPATGTTVRRGATLYESDGRRVPLLYGPRPAWRDLGLGVTDGTDVRQLERNLRALGYTGFTVDRHYDLGTYWAVRRWQRAARLPVTGAVPLGQVVFLPGALRVTGHDIGTGRPATGQVLHGTGAAPVVTLDLDPAVAPSVRRGDRVRVTLPDGAVRPGRVTRVSGVAQPGEQQDGAQAPSTIPATVRLAGKRFRMLDQALVQVDITTERRANVLTVPVVALLARPGGTYAVVTVDGGRRTAVPVEVGLFDEVAGTVEVTGVTEGTMVEVPAG
ncbi:peptidoglycan-binding protein [Sphaerisporangium rubeum]|uniref:Peptidoglycan hydrolase-like protein with peptidoglycan-binding domain n=1 Tax=Sphaerisporangium rubeum TaxID=321317 RepID=A0A7X0M718_9ACTN|nr:peptidoglycan-binding protein [Sphaerisporangium rubeum]MBB6472564.1 peptidoglycan hydrolase-like protein with peptidoglycan-binding domain [Sphaerisporangium rubeum]